jgi:Restriction endonuclease S subunits
MGEATKTTLGDLAKAGHLEFGDGYRTKRAEHGKPGIPILRVAEVLDGKILPALEDYVSDAYRDSMGQKISQPGDVVLTTKGTVGRVAIMPSNSPEFVYSPQLCYFRLRPGSPLLARYLYYWFKSEQFWSQARSRKSQTDMADYLNLADIRSLEISLPELREQQAVTSVLGALDDKIAVNERITDSCDKLAESLLDQLLAEDTEVKEIPLGEIAKINPRTVKPVAGGYLRYIDISCVSAGRIEWPKRLPWDKAPGRARRGVSPGDTIWSTVRPGRRSYALILDKDPEIVVSTGFVVLTPVKVGPAFLYEIVKRDAFVRYLENVAEGSAYPAVRPERFASATIPLPSVHTLQRFEDAVMPLRCRAHAADQESRTLAQLRDTLLPKLMSGELRVRDAEKAVEEAL